MSTDNANMYIIAKAVVKYLESFIHNIWINILGDFYPYLNHGTMYWKITGYTYIYNIFVLNIFVKEYNKILFLYKRIFF